MNILLTGSTGFIGAALTERLIYDGHSVFVIVRKTTVTDHINSSAKVYVFDDSYQKLSNFILANKIDGLLHLATYFVADHKYDDIEKLIDSNVTFPLKMLEISIKSGVQWVINTGTVWQNYNNSNTYFPTNLYSASKQSFDDLLVFYRETSNIKITTLKLCDTYGPNDTRVKIMNLLKKTINKDMLDMSPGEQLIDILYIDDVVDGYIKLIKYISNPKHIIENEYVLTSQKPIKLKDLVCVFENVCNSKIPIRWGGKVYRNREIMVPWSGGRIVPEWKAKIGLEAGIKLFLEKENNIE